MQQQGGVFAHTLHLLQFLRRSLQDALQAAEPLQQAVSRLVGVLPRNGVKQRQLQQLMVGQRVRAHLTVALLCPLPVPVVQSHCVHLPPRFFE